MGTSDIRRRQDNGEGIKEESDVVRQTQAQVFQVKQNKSYTRKYVQPIL